MPKTRKTAGRRARRAKQPPRRPGARALESTLADLAHEMRTALSSILALGELLAASDLGQRERQWAATIRSTAEHLASFAGLIVDAARAEKRGLVLRPEVISPRRFAEALASSLAARAQAKALHCEVTISDRLPDAVIVDRVRLRAALENLIDNAVKFTETGAVRLAVTCEDAARGKTRLAFAVADSGVGLSAAEIKRLFRPFAQANPQVAHRFGGAGLGLASARRIARAMGGDLEVTSEKGRGSRFRLHVLAERAATAEAGKVEANGARAPAMRPLVILCAEDNPYGRVVLNTILSELGHRADFVGSGAAAVNAVGQVHYDAVLMDVMLPGVDGLEAARRIRALASAANRTPIIGISGRSEPGNDAAARAAGMDAYLRKPISPSALSEAIAAVTSKGLVD
jgi:two-component system, sensor histidine kinase